MKDILDAVCEVSNVPAEDIQDILKYKDDVLKAKGLFFYACKTEGISAGKSASYLGMKSRSTAYGYITSYKNRMDVDKEAGEWLKEVLGKIEHKKKIKGDHYEIINCSFPDKPLYLIFKNSKYLLHRDSLYNAKWIVERMKGNIKA